MKMNLKTVALLIGLCGSSLWASEVWVDQSTGSDKPDGSPSAPFKTVDAALSAVKGAGDTIIIRKGVYRESLSKVPAGNAQSPFTIKSAPGEHVVISGATVVEGWKKGENDLWTAIIPAAPLEVFFKG